MNGSKAMLLTLAFVAQPLGAHAATCVGVPDSTPSPPVVACETDREYQFNIAGTKRTFDKLWFQTRLWEALDDWFSMTGADRSVLSGARVDFWLSVPEANPAGTQARAVLRSGEIDLVAYFSMEPEKWALTRDQVGNLLEGEYPESFGAIAGRLLVKTKPGISKAQLDPLLAIHGASALDNFSGLWWVIDVAPFEEISTKESLESDLSFPLYLEKVQYNYLYEWIAWRENVFSFQLPRGF